jgi:hypothetical protein
MNGDMMPGDDMSGPVSFKVIGLTTAYELDSVSLTITATTSATSSGLTLIATAGVPTGATFVPNGPSGTLTWTPTYTQAGSYTVALTATSADQTVSSTYMLPITIKNYVDTLINPDGTYPQNAVPIGDFDGDGNGDIAVCSADATNQNYLIRVLYGDPTGMPPATPYPLQRTKLYTIVVGAGNTIGGGAVSCRGGDFDGDGKADVVFAAPTGNRSGDPSNTGRIFVAFGNTRLADTLTTEELLVPSPTNGMLLADYNWAVADFNGDTKMDVVAMPVSGVMSNGTDDRYFIWEGSARAAGVSPAVVYTPNAGIYCWSGIVVGAGDVNKDGKADILFQDPDVGLASTTSCPGSPSGTYGGVRLLLGSTATTGLTAQDLSHPTARSDALWTQIGAVCDVDHDGYGDLALQDMTGLYVFYGSATGVSSTMSPIDLTGLSPVTADLDSGASRPLCVTNFYGSSTIVDPVGNNKVYLVTGGSRSPSVTVTLTSPAGSDSMFGNYLGAGAADINGDGKQDIVVGTATAGGHVWVFYGK